MALALYFRQGIIEGVRKGGKKGILVKDIQKGAVGIELKRSTRGILEFTISREE